jgi:hypothetical protein
MQISMEERLVLSVLRYSNLTAPSASAIGRLIDLDGDAVQYFLGRLIERGLCRRVSTDHIERYRPVGPSEAPLRNDCSEWLATLCPQLMEVEDGDSEAVTFWTCGIVILAAIVTGSREPALVADLTRLPIDFVRLTLELCRQLHLWWSLRFFELARTVREQGDDAKEVSDALQSVIEEFSLSFMSETIADMLHRSREHVQYGGGRDPWPTVPDRVELEMLLKGSSW